LGFLFPFLIFSKILPVTSRRTRTTGTRGAAIPHVRRILIRERHKFCSGVGVAIPLYVDRVFVGFVLAPFVVEILKRKIGKYTPRVVKSWFTHSDSGRMTSSSGGANPFASRRSAMRFRKAFLVGSCKKKSHNSKHMEPMKHNTARPIKMATVMPSP